MAGRSFFAYNEVAEKGGRMISYNNLSDGAKDVIEMTKQRFADCFDADCFGPFLNNFRRFDDDRLAVLLDIAIGNLSTYITMPTTWSIESYPFKSPTFRYAAILSLTIEVISHLKRSYVEIPDTSSIQAPDVKRRDYLTRWDSALKDLQDQMKQVGKKMVTEMYAAQADAGLTQSVLIDLPSTSGWNWPVGYAEKETYWGWW